MANIEFEEQVKRFTNNLEQAKKEGDKFKQCDSLENLAICFSAKSGHEDPQKAVNYYNQAINISSQIDSAECSTRPPQLWAWFMKNFFLIQLEPFVFMNTQSNMGKKY